MSEPIEPLALQQPKLLGEFTVRIEEMPYDNTDDPLTMYVATGWMKDDEEDENPEDMMGRAQFRTTSYDIVSAAGKCIANLVNYAKGQYLQDAKSPIEPPKAEEGKAPTSFGNG